MNIKIIVVVFNSALEDSETLVSLNEQLEGGYISAELIIYDNSSISMYDQKIVTSLQKKYKVCYKHTPQNLTLREIYNQAICSLDSNEYLMFLDDDTRLPKDFFYHAEQNIKNYSAIDLFVPKIFVKGSLYSPHRCYSFIDKKLNKLNSGKNVTRNISAINSGMIIKSSYFKSTNFIYPDFVDYYGTDRVFFDNYAMQREEFCIMDVCVHHDVSNHPGNDNTDEYLKILKKVNDFWLKYLTFQGKSTLPYKIFMLFYLVKMAMKKRNLAFIRHAIKLGFKDAK